LVRPPLRRIRLTSRRLGRPGPRCAGRPVWRRTPRNPAPVRLALRGPHPATPTGGSMPKLISRRSAPGLVFAAVLLAATIAAATASARPTRTHASIQACALLPDTKSSTRYKLFDATYV